MLRETRVEPAQLNKIEKTTVLRELLLFQVLLNDVHPPAGVQLNLRKLFFHATRWSKSRKSYDKSCQLVRMRGRSSALELMVRVEVAELEEPLAKEPGCLHRRTKAHEPVREHHLGSFHAG